METSHWYLIPLIHLFILMVWREGIKAIVPPNPPLVNSIKSILFVDGNKELDYEQYARAYSSKKRRDAEDQGTSLNYSICETVLSVPEDIRLKYNLDPFYEKYTHANGIPILSSERVSDEALQRACYVVRFLVADRMDIRDGLYEGGARVSIIGTNELTNDIPEYSYLSNSWNERARALGGTRQNPVTAVAEENLLCESVFVDRWWEEDALVHEFVHAIHLIALDVIDDTFTDRLKEIYNEAKLAGRWQNHYARTNFREYLAEGAQSFFDVNTHRDFVDNVHNNISTRGALMGYDLPLFDLITEIFPCQNVILDRCNDQGLVNTWPLKADCGAATTEDTTKITTEATTQDTILTSMMVTTVESEIPAFSTTDSKASPRDVSTNIAVRTTQENSTLTMSTKEPLASVSTTSMTTYLTSSTTALPSSSPTIQLLPTSEENTLFTASTEYTGSVPPSTSTMFIIPTTVQTTFARNTPNTEAVSVTEENVQVTTTTHFTEPMTNTETTPTTMSSKYSTEGPLTKGLPVLTDGSQYTLASTDKQMTKSSQASSSTATKRTTSTTSEVTEVTLTKSGATSAIRTASSMGLFDITEQTMETNHFSATSTSTFSLTQTTTTSSTFTECSDTLSFCADFLSEEDCYINPVLEDLCHMTCNSCPGCHDYHRLCPDLARRGFCSRKKEFMKSHCPKSCQIC